MAHVTRTGEWVVDAELSAVDGAITRAASQHGLAVRPDSPERLELRGGSQVKMRLKGAWFAKDTDLPVRGTVLREDDHPVHVVLTIEDAMGFGVLDSKTKQKYERILDSIVFSARVAIQALERPTATEADPVGELERLAKMYAEGTLTDEEFAAAKARLLGH